MKAEKSLKFINKNIAIDKAVGINQQAYLNEIKNEILELERLSELYESSKQYIEFGKALEEMFKEGAEIHDCGTYIIDSVDGLIDWIEGVK